MSTARDAGCLRVPRKTTSKYRPPNLICAIIEYLPMYVLTRCQAFFLRCRQARTASIVSNNLTQNPVNPLRYHLVFPNNSHLLFKRYESHPCAVHDTGLLALQSSSTPERLVYSPLIASLLRVLLGVSR